MKGKFQFPERPNFQIMNISCKFDRLSDDNHLKIAVRLKELEAFDSSLNVKLDILKRADNKLNIRKNTNTLKTIKNQD